MALSHDRPTPPARLVHWDVDHTLIDNGGLSKETYAAAFEALTGRPAAEPPRTDGRTDPEVMRDLFARNGVAPELVTLQAVADALVSALAQRLPSLRRRGCALPGAREALTALVGRPGVVQSVLTGNIRPNAAAKLAAFDLAHLVDFDAGGYGSDDAVRSRLVTVARARAAARYGHTFDESRTVLVGDTPRDVRAAHDAGVCVLAVASGTSTPAALAAAGADTVLPDLRDTAAVIAALSDLM